MASIYYGEGKTIESYKMNGKTGAILISGKCDYGCVFCKGESAWDQLDDPVYFQQMERDVAENILNLIEEECTSIEISGNDPGEYPHIVNLIRYLKSFDQINSVILSTNGVRPAYMLEELKEAGLDLLRFPIYGHTNEVLSGTISRPNSIVEIKKILQESKIPLNPHVSITKSNYKHLIDIFEFIRENSNQNIYRIYIDRVLPTEDDWSFFVNLEDLRAYMTEFHQYIFQNMNNDDFPQVDLILENCLIDHYDRAFKTGYGPKLGKQQYREELKTELEDVPTYRIRDAIEPCLNCMSYKKEYCLGMLRKEYRKFGDLTRPIIED